MQPSGFAQPVVTRSRLALEVASELVGNRAFRPQQARISLRRQGAQNPWEMCLFGSDAPSVIDEVARGDVQLAIINPADILALAVRGTGPFTSPLPLRIITVIPSSDEFLFAVSERTGLTSLTDIRDQRYPLKISMRSQLDHSDYVIVNAVLGALGFSLDDIVSWGGEIHHHGFPPNPRAVERGEVDAIFDEAVDQWAPLALDVGMRFLELAEPLLTQLERMGFRRSTIERAEYPALAADINTLDFSGWPVFTREDAPDDFIRMCCAAMEARKDRVPWQGVGPLPIERMCIDAPDTPLTAPLHPAAEAYWRERGYIA